MAPEYGETWAYESIIGALPGIELPTRAAIAIQFLAFQGAVLVLAAVYDLWSAAVAGTVAVLVATVGSVEMVRIGRLVRGAADGDGTRTGDAAGSVEVADPTAAVDTAVGTDATNAAGAVDGAAPSDTHGTADTTGAVRGVPDTYRRLLFGSSIEVVLAVLAYVALLTHLFVFDPQQGGTPLLERLLGPEPPVLVVYLLLLVLWDICYRIGTGWWASVAGLWRSVRYRFEPGTARAFRRSDAETMAFGLLQLVLVPFLDGAPVLQAAVVGHVAAVTLVTGASMLLLWTKAEPATP